MQMLEEGKPQNKANRVKVNKNACVMQFAIWGRSLTDRNTWVCTVAGGEERLADIMAYGSVGKDVGELDPQDQGERWKAYARLSRLIVH